MSTKKSRSPNHPQKPLDWAVTSALQILDIEGTHPMPRDVAAIALGYSSAINGAARRALATMKSFGLLVREGDRLILSESVRRYKLSPSEDAQNAILREWLYKPTLFAKLKSKYGDPPPSDGVLLHDLVIDEGFTEAGAKKAIAVFRASLAYVPENTLEEDDDDFNQEFDTETTQPQNQINSQKPHDDHHLQQAIVETPTESSSNPNRVRYPVRLAGGRMAYIDLPEEFYNRDKKKLKAQLEVIGTLDEDDDDQGGLDDL